MVDTSLRTVGQLLTRTGETTVYTCPAHFSSIIRTLYVNNLHSGAVDVSINVVLTSVSLPILTTKSMAADTILDVLDKNPIALGASDTIVVTAGNANSLNVIITLEESFTGS
jgi:myosin-crossreactive antigen